mgnify:CR=1 FL=1|jgi:DNA-binding CsgD family transcriptional regulator|tara:strand:- start:370 stop:630 length:261 start_codon:yes stop_codon:yes gene_type:complete
MKPVSQKTVSELCAQKWRHISRAEQRLLLSLAGNPEPTTIHEIAEIAGRSIETMRTHIHNIRRKLTQADVEIVIVHGYRLVEKEKA